MPKYPIVGDDPPWKNTTELGITAEIAGVPVVCIPVLDAVTGDVLLGSAGFEANDPYILVHNLDISILGDLHGKPVIIDDVHYTIRNVRNKPGIDMTRLLLKENTQ